MLQNCERSVNQEDRSMQNIPNKLHRIANFIDKKRHHLNDLCCLRENCYKSWKSKKI